MTKKGFTLMELLVSIFISGMVMLALVAMWKTSSNHTVQAQRQSIIRNESTVFLRKIYSDFVSASEIICPKGYESGTNYTCPTGALIAVKEAVLRPRVAGDVLVRTTAPHCGSNNNEWATTEDVSTISSRCIRPSFTVYCRKDDQKMYRYNHSFLDGGQNFMPIQTLVSSATAICSDENNEDLEVIMPYIENFTMNIHATDDDKDIHVEYTIKREFGEDIPDVYFKFNHFLTQKRGV